MSPPPELALLPDVERLVSAFLRSSARVTALVGDRVYTAFPAGKGADPLVLIQRIGGEPLFPRPLVTDGAQLQVDAYGGGKAAAHKLVATVRAVLTELEGYHGPEGTVAAVVPGALRWQPDETYKPPRPRYITDFFVHVKAPAGPPARTTARPSGGNLVAGAAAR